MFMLFENKIFGFTCLINNHFLFSFLGMGLSHWQGLLRLEHSARSSQGGLGQVFPVAILDNESAQLVQRPPGARLKCGLASYLR